MKRYLPWLHAVPVIVFIIIGLVAYTKYTAWRGAHEAEDKRILATTIKTFKATNDTIEALHKRLARRRPVIQRLRAEADTEHAKQTKILAEHPISTAPVACAPWTTALLSCQLEASKLRHVSDSLQADLDDALKVVGQADTTIKQGTEVLESTKCGFPCIHFRVIVGAGLDDQAKFRKGVFAGLQIM